jgi:putative copper resistance protein D
VPLGDGRDIIRRLGGRPPILFPVITDGAGDIATTYTLLARGFASAAPAGRAAPPLHAEFLIDRQGYIRARWLPGSPGPAWDRPATLTDQIQLLDKETPAGPAPDEHVH